MATWEDGPEYAPRLRPDEFSPAVSPALEAALTDTPQPAAPVAAAPEQRPHFSAPQAEGPPLAALVPPVVAERDPQLPFAVASSTLTSMDSAWGAAHWNATQASAPPPVTPALAASSAPIPTPTGPATLPSGYPPPGTPGWFGPGPAALERPSPAAPPDLRTVLNAATPGMCICLAIGGFLYLFAPLTLGLAFVLSKRVRVAQEQVRHIFLLAGGFVGLLSVAGLLLSEVWLVSWWSFVGVCCLTVSWVVLVAVLVVVYRALASGRPGSPAGSSSWS